VLRSGMEYGALGGVVSGSGPTIAFLVEDNEAGIDLAVALTASGVVRDVRRATGPVHGAHVIPHRVD
jgi:4-diphosphocytidyl-2-C-methyl-D-erythritol kinase